MNTEFKEIWKEVPAVLKVLVVVQVIGYAGCVYIAMHFILKFW